MIFNPTNWKIYPLVNFVLFYGGFLYLWHYYHSISSLRHEYRTSLLSQYGKHCLIIHKPWYPFLSYHIKWKKTVQVEREGADTNFGWFGDLRGLCPPLERTHLGYMLCYWLKDIFAVQMTLFIGEMG